MVSVVAAAALTVTGLGTVPAFAAATRTGVEATGSAGPAAGKSAQQWRPRYEAQNPHWVSKHARTDHPGKPSTFSTVTAQFRDKTTGPTSRMPSRHPGGTGVQRDSLSAATSTSSTTATASATTATAPTAPFTQCPAIGADSSCGLLIEITDSGAVVYGDPTQGPYDGVEDTLIGVVNDSSKTMGALALTSSTDLFGFDGDGICYYGVPCGKTGYEGPNTNFSDISSDYTSGVVNFPAGLAVGDSTYFSLEEALSTSNVSTGSGQSPVTAYEVGQTPNPRENQKNCSTKKPVNCATGVFWHTFDDLSIPGRGPALDLQRSYSSLLAGNDGMFGHGWSNSYGMNLTTDSSGVVTVHQENGSTISFTPNGSAYTAPSRVTASLAKNSDGTFTLTDFHGGIAHTFSATGQLLGIADRNGYTTTLTYNGAVLSAVTDPAGRTLTFTTDTTGHVSTVSDSAGRQLSYRYDAAGDLTSATDVTGGTWSFGYDSNHQLLTMTDPRGGVVTNTYDTNGRVTTQVDAMGRKTTLSYSGDPATTSGGTTTITDPRGLVTVEQYQDMAMQSITHASGTAAAATTTYSYDPFTLEIASKTDPNQNTTTYSYDRRGNLLSTTDPLGRTTNVAWTGLNEPASITDPAGNSTTFSYDSAGNLTAVARAVDASTTQTTTYGYGDSAHPGDVTSIVDPDGNTWTLGYDAEGNLTSRTDPLGERTSYGYDKVGDRTSVVSARGNVTGADPSAYTTTYAYDAARDLTKVTDPLGEVTRFGYDANHNQVSSTDADGNTTTTTYNADDEPTQVTRADGTTVSYGYDADGDQTAQTDAAGHTTHYGYDQHNQVATVKDALARVTSYGYDPAGNLTSLTDPKGATTTLAYDGANERTQQTYSDGQTATVTYTYDVDGRRASMVDGTGTTSYSYDGLGRLTAQTNGHGQRVGYGYDLVGNVVSLTYPNGKAVNRGYDAAGRLTSLTDWNGHTTSLNPDAEGHTVSETFGNGVTAHYGIDATGTMTSTKDTDPNGATLASLNYTRDANRQLTGASQTGLPGADESYSYTQLNQLAKVSNNSYGYDAAGNITQLLDGATLGYDAADQATSYTAADGTKTSLTYNADGQRISGPGQAGASMSYGYDQAGRLTTAAGASGAGGAAAAGLIAGGQYHSLAVDSAGTVWAWGDNTYGQLGDGTTTSATSPVQTNAPAATAVTAGLLSSAALTRSGTVVTWGNNTYGQLGDGTTTQHANPVPVTGLGNVTQIAAGNYHMLALKSDGTVVAWGLNNAGQLGDGTSTQRTNPVSVTGLANVVQVAAGGLPGYAGHSVALEADGSVWTWGYGKSGQLGLGSATTTPTPTKVTGLPAITQIAASGDNTYALAKDGSVWAWGDNSYGQIGNPNAKHTQTSPLQVQLTGTASFIAAGGTHALALTSDGTAWGWGNNNTGQLGDGGACGKTCDTPTKITSLTDATVLAGGYVHSLAALSDGTMRGWGRNAEGELGDGTTTARLNPVTVTGLSGIRATKATYAYDGDGLRASRTAGGATQHFAWSLQAAAPLLLTDGALTYLYDDTGLPVEQTDSAGTTLYYQHDQYGSTRLLTDNSGAVVASYTYDPYGNLTGHTGTADTTLRWNGQYQDTDTGLYYLRARYYDPLTAQFMTVDSLVALTQQAYGYAGNNPLRYADPLGLDFLGLSGRTWATIGLVAGGIAVAATGVGLAAEGLGAAGLVGAGAAEAASGVMGETALVTGAVAVGTDAVPCVASIGSAEGPDGAACTGAILGAASLGYGAPGVFIGDMNRGVRALLDAHAFGFGYAGWAVDANGYFEQDC